MKSASRTFQHYKSYKTNKRMNSDKLLLFVYSKASSFARETDLYFLAIFDLGCRL